MTLLYDLNKKVYQQEAKLEDNEIPKFEGEVQATVEVHEAETNTAY